MNKQINKKKFAATSMVVLGIGLIVGGDFAALSDTLTHNETVTIEWVDIVNGSDDDLALENVNDVTNTPVIELTPGMTYELTGTLENDSTVITDWTATDLSNVPGMTVTIADADGEDTPTAVGEAIDVSQFGITVQVDQSIDPSTPLNFSIEFSSTDAREAEVPPAILAEPTAISEVFPDPALALCVANDSESGAGGDVNYVITQEVLDGFNDFQCGAKGVTNIEGVQYMNNVTTLNLYGNQISDITPLSNLTNLTVLHLAENQVNNIDALAELTNLTHLYLNENQIDDISVVANMTDLTHLYLSYNKISDITPLSDLTKLEELHLGNNQISDISALSNLTNLEILYVNVNFITDISALANLTNLTELYLGDNDFEDISALTNLTNLTMLNLKNNNISDIYSLAGLTNLTYLNLYGNTVTDISALANLTNLNEVYLSSNYITDFSSLTYQPAIFVAYQHATTLPPATLGEPTPIAIDGINGEDLIITWTTPGTYVDGQLTWDNPGYNSLTFTSADGSISGTVKQNVYSDQKT